LIVDFLPESHLDDDKILAGDVPKAIFRSALTECGNEAEFVDEFIQVLQDFSEYKFYRQIKTFMLDYLKEHFSDRESTWKLLALSVDNNSVKRIKSSNEASSFDKSCKIFAEALEQLPTELMWQHFLMYLLDQVAEASNDKEIQSKRMDLFVKQSNECWSKAMFSKSLFLKQFDFFEKFQWSSSDVRSGVNLGLKKWEHDVEVWHRYIKYVMNIEHDSEAKVVIKTLFSKALNRLLLVQLDSTSLRNQFDQNFAQFVNLYIDWITENLGKKECTQIFEKLCVINTSAKDLRLARKLAAICKSVLLKTLSKFGDHDRVRRAYEKYHMMNPISQEFYSQMLDLELDESNASLDVPFARGVFNQMLAHFGQDDHQVWLRFARFEMKHGSHVKASDVYHMAKLRLSPKESNLFVQEYQMIHV
jgi:hypothetical protein